ncbi:MAG: MoaD/ThiS family protein [Methanotrichaceae archaeon]|nr:MoaD/ThiS family protein [Methanotrichaceae archaeon]
MLVKVLAFAGFREILGKERELSLNESVTVKELLAELAVATPRFKEAAFDESGALRDYVLLMINRKLIDSRQDLSRPLQEGDELAIFPPLAGG